MKDMKDPKKPSRIKRVLKKHGVGDITIAFIMKELQRRDTKLEHAKTALEVANRVCIDLDKRYFVIEHVSSSNSKITINPCTGRVALKVSDKCTIQVQKDLTKLAMQIFNEEEIAPVTHRGRVRWVRDRYKITISSESDRFHRKYEYIPCEVKNGI